MQTTIYIFNILKIGSTFKIYYPFSHIQSATNKSNSNIKIQKEIVGHGGSQIKLVMNFITLHKYSQTYLIKHRIT